MGDSIEQLTFASDEIELVVLPGLGARIHALRYRGHDLLHTPATPQEHLRDPFFWGSYLMAPWCNRIAPGPVRVADRLVDLPSNYPDGTAIHGQVYIAPWERQGDELVTTGGGTGWPWRYRAAQRFRVDGSVVRIEQRLDNVDDGPMPGGIGIHPWFAGKPLVAIHSDRVYSTNSDTPPSAAAVSGDLDLRRLGPMAVGVDATWPVGLSPVALLEWPDKGIGVEISVEAEDAFVVSANPGDRAAIALETQTHAPQGLRRLVNHEPGALTMIAPGASLTLATTLRISSR